MPGDPLTYREAYAGELYRCIKRNYVIEGIEATQVQGRRALVSVRVERDGRLGRHRLLESSGLPAFDQAVSRAVSRCGQISPPPPSLVKKLHAEGMDIEFVP